jgi:hypothetical protein
MNYPINILHRQNHWVTSDKHYDFGFVHWSIVLPYPKNDGEIRGLVDLYKLIAKIGEEQRIYCVAPSGNSEYNIQEYNSHPDYIGQNFLARPNARILPEFVHGSVVYPASAYDVYTKLAYYNSGREITERYIKNVGDLMTKVYEIELDNVCVTRKPAVIMKSYDDLRHDNNSRICFEESTINIYISLMTDIWFPWVNGIIHHFRPCHEGICPLPINHPVFGEMYDNRELASYSTS